jgi:hypothetical protein
MRIRIVGDNMGSIRLVYDSEGDILDVDFRLTGEKPRQGIELHDNITVWTNVRGTRILRLMFLSYGRLLEQADLRLVKLKKLRARQRAGLLKLLTSDPVKRFLVCVNEKALRFRVADPGVRAGAAA